MWFLNPLKDLISVPHHVCGLIFGKENVMSYKIVSLAASVLFITLFACLLFVPNVIYWLIGVEHSPTADLLAKRAAMLFLGLSVLSFLGRNESSSNLRQTVIVAMATTLAGLMIAGMYEFFFGIAGVGIWFAIGGEALFLSLYLVVWFKDSPKLKSRKNVDIEPGDG